MDFSSATFWWVAAGAAVAVELASGTFYLLMIALGLAAGALAAHLGSPFSGQVIVAALVGASATALWHWRRYSRPRSAPVHENRDVNLDIGERITVTQWDTDRTARVQYRGSGWTVRLVPGADATPGEFRVTAVEGNWLVLAPAAADAATPH